MGQSESKCKKYDDKYMQWGFTKYRIFSYQSIPYHRTVTSAEVDSDTTFYLSHHQSSTLHTDSNPLHPAICPPPDTLLENILLHYDDNYRSERKEKQRMALISAAFDDICMDLSFSDLDLRSEDSTLISYLLMNRSIFSRLQRNQIDSNFQLQSPYSDKLLGLYIQSLDFSNNPHFGSKGVISLFTFCPLLLQDCGLPSRFSCGNISHFPNRYEGIASSLTILDLSHCGIDDEGAIFIANNLLTERSSRSTVKSEVKRCNRSDNRNCGYDSADDKDRENNNEFQVSGVEPYSKAHHGFTCVFPHLEKLILDRNHISDKGFIAICDAVYRCFREYYKDCVVKHSNKENKLTDKNNVKVDGLDCERFSKLRNVMQSFPNPFVRNRHSSLGISGATADDESNKSIFNKGRVVTCIDTNTMANGAATIDMGTCGSNSHIKTSCDVSPLQQGAFCLQIGTPSPLRVLPPLKSQDATQSKGRSISFHFNQDRSPRVEPTTNNTNIATTDPLLFSSTKASSTNPSSSLRSLAPLFVPKFRGLSLKVLSFRYNRITDKSAPAIGRLMGYCESPRLLSAQCFHCHDSHEKEDHQPHFPCRTISLDTIDLFGNSIGDDGLLGLIEYLTLRLIPTHEFINNDITDRIDMPEWKETTSSLGGRRSIDSRGADSSRRSISQRNTNSYDKTTIQRDQTRRLKLLNDKEGLSYSKIIAYSRSIQPSKCRAFSLLLGGNTINPNGLAFFVTSLQDSQEGITLRYLSALEELEDQFEVSRDECWETIGNTFHTDAVIDNEEELTFKESGHHSSHVLTASSLSKRSNTTIYQYNNWYNHHHRLHYRQKELLSIACDVVSNASHFSLLTCLDLSYSALGDEGVVSLMGLITGFSETSSLLANFAQETVKKILLKGHEDSYRSQFIASTGRNEAKGKRRSINVMDPTMPYIFQQHEKKADAMALGIMSRLHFPHPFMFLKELNLSYVRCTSYALESIQLVFSCIMHQHHMPPTGTGKVRTNEGPFYQNNRKNPLNESDTIGNGASIPVQLRSLISQQRLKSVRSLISSTSTDSPKMPSLKLVNPSQFSPKRAIQVRGQRSCETNFNTAEYHGNIDSYTSNSDCEIPQAVQLIPSVSFTDTHFAQYLPPSSCVCTCALPHLEKLDLSGNTLGEFSGSLIFSFFVHARNLCDSSLTIGNSAAKRGSSIVSDINTSNPKMTGTTFKSQGTDHTIYDAKYSGRVIRPIMLCLSHCGVDSNSVQYCTTKLVKLANHVSRLCTSEGQINVWKEYMELFPYH